jgi:hypothetical protein
MAGRVIALLCDMHHGPRYATQASSRRAGNALQTTRHRDIVCAASAKQAQRTELR